MHSEAPDEDEDGEEDEGVSEADMFGDGTTSLSLAEGRRCVGTGTSNHEVEALRQRALKHMENQHGRATVSVELRKHTRAS